MTDHAKLILDWGKELSARREIRMSYMKDHLMDVATSIWKQTGCTWAEAMAKATGQDVEDCLSGDPALDNETWEEMHNRKPAITPPWNFENQQPKKGIFLEV